MGPTAGAAVPVLLLRCSSSPNKSFEEQLRSVGRTVRGKPVKLFQLRYLFYRHRQRIRYKTMLNPLQSAGGMS